MNLMDSHVVIGKPERHVRKASHCGSKQQQRSCAAITLRVHYCYVQSFTSLVSQEIARHNHSYLLVRATYIWVLLFAHIPFVVNRTFNVTPTDR